MAAYHLINVRMRDTKLGRGGQVRKAGGSLNFKVPKRQRSLSADQKSAVARMFAEARARGTRIKLGAATCPVIFFKRKRGGKTAVQRCEGARTFKTKTWARAAATRAKRLCHVRSGPKQGRFVRCRRR